MDEGASDRDPMVIIYAAGMLLGLVMVSFPASGTVLKEIKGLSDAQYGLIYIPQIISAVAGSVASGWLARAVGLKRLLFGTLIAMLLSQVGLFIAVEAVDAGPAFTMVLAAPAMSGLAFGVGASCIQACRSRQDYDPALRRWTYGPPVESTSSQGAATIPVRRFLSSP